MDPLRALVRSAVDTGLFPGAAYRVFLHPGRLLAAGNVGLAQCEPEIPVADETVWDLASLTKPLATATSILILAQEGAIHLGEEVGRFLHGDCVSLAGITLRHLLTHSSGLRPWEQLYGKGLDRKEILARVRDSERQRPVGAGYAYSDLGYILLGEVVEAVSGQRLDRFAEERIFGPLGMADTRFSPNAKKWASRLAATRCPDRGRVLVGEVHDGNCAAMGGVAGHAGLFGTARDLELYAHMLLCEGEWNGAQVLAPLTARAMVRNHNPEGLSGHTLGWFTRPNGYLPVGDFLPADTFGHTGFTGTSLVMSPSLGLVAILLTNRVHYDIESADFLRFRRRFHNAVASLVSSPAPA